MKKIQTALACLTLLFFGCTAAVDTMSHTGTEEDNSRNVVIQIVHDVTITAGPGGSVSPAGVVTIQHGNYIDLVITPDTGYALDKVTVDNVVLEYPYSIGPVEKEMSVHISFKQVPMSMSVTYNWIYDCAQEPIDVNSPMVDLLDIDGKVIKTVPEAMAKRIALEGEAFLEDGRHIILSNSFDWPESRFEIIDPEVAYWGFDLFGNPRTPWKTVSIPSLPYHSNVYIKQFNGLQLPDGSFHDGWFVNTGENGHLGYVDIFLPGEMEFQYIMQQITVNQVEVVYEMPQLMDVYLYAGTGGSVLPADRVEVPAGGSQLIRFKPLSGYVVDTVTVDGVPVAYNSVMNTLTLKNVTASTVVDVTFKAGPVTFFSYTATAGANGTVNPPAGYVMEGADQVFEITPHPGYTINMILLNGVAQTYNGSHVFVVNNVQENIHLEVTFTNSCELHHQGKAGPGGTITPGEIHSHWGEDVNFVITPDPGYEIDTLTLNGTPIAPVLNLTLTQLTENTLVEVTFRPVDHVELTAEYVMGQDWGTGFAAEVVITNKGTEAAQAWKVVLTFSGNQKITGWNGVFSQTGNVVTIINTSWNNIIAPGATVKVGLNGSYTGYNDIPTVYVTHRM